MAAPSGQEARVTPGAALRPAGRKGPWRRGGTAPSQWLKQLPVLHLLSCHKVRCGLRPAPRSDWRKRPPSGLPGNCRRPLLAPRLPFTLSVYLPIGCTLECAARPIGRADTARPVAIARARPFPRSGPGGDGGRRRRRGRSSARRGAGAGAQARARAEPGDGGGGRRLPRLPALPVAAGRARGQDRGPSAAQGRPPPPPAGDHGQGEPR